MGTSVRVAPFRVEPWMESAQCRAAADPDIWFSDSHRRTDLARAHCAVCPVEQECLTYALSYPHPLHGIWGGCSARQRDQMKHRKAS